MRTVAVGETPGRVERAARGAGIDYYGGRTDHWYDALLPRPIVGHLRKRDNARWLHGVMDSQAVVIDDGINPHQILRGPSYQMESAMLEGYPTRYDASVWPDDRP